MDEDQDQDYYEWSLTPQNASEENKTGVSFKGRDIEYINAHGKIVELFKKKGEKFALNGIELSIADKQKNKPINIEIKSKKGFTGKVNLKIYDVNNRGGATMLITKPSGGEMAHVKLLAFDVIKFLLDNIISGNITDEHMAGYKVKVVEAEIKNKCVVCEKVFTTENRLQLHLSKFHASNGNKCDDCEEEFYSLDDLEKHRIRKHSIENSPEAKKIRILEDKGDKVELEMMDIDVQVEEKVILSKQRDIKVLEKQRSIEKEMELMKQMRQKKEMLKEQEDKKRKRQMSVEKKKRKKKNKKESMLSREASISSGKEVNTEQEDVGPGYMGHTHNDEKEARSLSYEELCQAYINLNQEYKELKEKFDKVNDTKDREDVKNIRILTKEIRNLKDEYKECVEALKKETQDKVKAETTAKVLKDIIETQDEILENRTENEEMDIDGGVGEWLQQQKRKPIKFLKQNREIYKCDRGGDNFPNKKTLKTHESTHIDDVYCSICDEIFVEKEEFMKHQKNHTEQDEFKCEFCKNIYYTKSELILHVKIHERSNLASPNQEQKLVNCSKCDKQYRDMSKLRRHDWRSHRNIPCNICGEELKCRQDISEHRKQKHGIHQTAVCKFYPNCFDQEECFFIHKDGIQYDDQKSLEVCQNGQDCNDQACTYSE